MACRALARLPNLLPLPLAAHTLPVATRLLATWAPCAKAARLSVCRSLLAVSPHASAIDIKAAFFAAAKRHHPDVNAVGGEVRDGDVFIRLRACYEELLLHAEEKTDVRPQVETIRKGNKMPREAGRPRRAMTWASLRAAGIKDKTNALEPTGIMVSSLGFHDKTSPGCEFPFCGHYVRAPNFNRRPSFVHQSHRYHFFWSEQFQDWKIAERLAETGLCVAYVDDNSGAAPWNGTLSTSSGHSGVAWTIWDPQERRFRQALVTVTRA